MAPMPLVNTVTPAASRCRATNSVVVPASTITTAPSSTSSAARRPIASFSWLNSRCRWWIDSSAGPVNATPP